MSTHKNILKSRKEIAEIDASNMLSSIEELDQQSLVNAWESTKSIKFSPTAEIRNVVISGMGGSGLGADVIKHLFKHDLAIPFDYVHSYTLPGYVDEHTLVVLSSYSGTTEEVLTTAADARERGAQIMVITAGGRLAEIAKEQQYPVYIIDPKHNPSEQPRMAIGYSVFGTISLLNQAGVISVTDKEVQAVIETISNQQKLCTVEVPQESNPAKTLAFNMIDRRPVILAAEFLEGAAHVAANQHNENGKAFVDYKVVPEINHHLMEGLRFPKSNAMHHVFFFVQSDLYNQRNIIRMNLTQKTVEKQGIESIQVKLKAKTKIEQTFELITLFAYSGFYLSMLEGIDPSPIPFVDAFKKELAEFTKSL